MPGWLLLASAACTLLLFVFQKELSQVLDRLDHKCTNHLGGNDLLLRTYGDFVCFKNVMFYTEHLPLARGNVVVGFDGIQRVLFMMELLWRISIACMLLAGAMTMSIITIAVLGIKE